MSFENNRDPPPPWTPVELHKPFTQHKDPSPKYTPPIFNILVLGPTQSGKSTFIEAVKQYADPSYVPDSTRIGGGNESHTDDVHIETVSTTLPVYRLYDNEENCEVVISRTHSHPTDAAYKALLRRDEGLEMWADELPRSQRFHFRLFDTPGLDDTKGNDIQNIAKTFSALSMVDEFHLVVITDNHHVPFMPSQKEAYQTYFDLFKELRTLITVVHTNVQNIHRHPANRRLDAKLTARSQFFNEVMCRTVPTKCIDCDFEETGPANLCLTRNTIREILEMAIVKVPVLRNKAVVQKTLMMKNVDRIVHEKYQAQLESVEQSCKALGEVDKLDVKIADTKADLKVKEDTLRDLDTGDLIALFEERFDEGVGFVGWFQDLFGRAGALHTISYSSHDGTIDDRRVLQGSIRDLTETGGVGKNSWKAQFRRDTFKVGYFHVVLSMTRRTKYRKTIDELKKAIEKLNKTLEDDTKEFNRLKGIVQRNADKKTSRENLERLKDKKAKYKLMVTHTSASKLSLNEFMELADSGIYKGSASDAINNAKSLERHLRKKFEVDVSG